MIFLIISAPHCGAFFMSSISYFVGTKFYMAKASKRPPAKATSKRTTSKQLTDKKQKSQLGIEYADKSAGQENLLPIFNKLVELFKPYETGSLTLKGGTKGEAALISYKPIEVLGRKKEEMYFAGALVQKGYVGFYYMPVYTDEEKKEVFTKPELLKLLKGKSCFHIKKMDDELEKQIKDALKRGYAAYKKKKWID